MIYAPFSARALTPRTRAALPAVFTLSALLLSGGGAAQDSTGEWQRIQRQSPGPTTDAPSDNPVYSIAQHADLRTRIKLQILWRKPMDGARVNVMNRGDSVVLDGQVRSEAERQLAERIALRTVGVGRVDNLLQVAPAMIDAEGTSASVSRAADPWISTRVAASLSFDRAVEAGRVHVSTDDGVVTLSGRVPSAAQKDVAAEIAADIDDVRSVKNVLGVDDPG
jgi:osmotically-inducible protein OsmY